MSALMEMSTTYDTPLLTALERLGPHDHQSLIFESPEDRFGVAIPFIRIGLDRGEKCIYIADDGNKAAVRDAMHAQGIDVERAVAANRLLLATQHDAFLRYGAFDADRMPTFWADAMAEAARQGFSALRATGETDWLLSDPPGRDRWMEYESRLTHVLAGLNCFALCQYNRPLLPPEFILNVIRTHPTVIYRGVVCRNMYHVPPDEFLSTNQTAREVERVLTTIRERAEIEYTLRQQGHELRQRVGEQEAIAQLGQIALRARQLPELFDEALDIITSTCSLEFAEVAELSPDQMLVLRAAVGWKEQLVGHAQLPAGSGSQCAFTLLSGAPSVVEDFTRESRFEVDPLIREQGMTSGVTVVIEGAGRPYGTLGMHSKDRRVFTQEDIHFLQAAANVLAAAIERERAEEGLRQSERLLRLVLDALPVGVAVVDLSGDIILSNPASQRIWGRSIPSGPERYAESKAWWYATGTRLAPGEWASRRAFVDGETSVNEVLEIEAFDGVRKIIQNSAVPMRDANGRITGAVVVNEDISARKTAERELNDSYNQMRTLSGRLMRAQDDERRRIAQMLHETTAQDLVGLKMLLARVNRTADRLGDAERSALAESISLAEQAMTQIRTLSYLLHPPFLDEAGLLSAIRWYAGGFAERSGIKVDLDLPESLERLPLDTETVLFRIVQEALTNIHRHAGSEAARIRLRRNAEELVLEIEDRGHGIPKASLKQIASGGGGAGVGISSMSERAEQLGGRLEIASSDHGTTVRIRLPLVKDAA